jgi:hypothetical protein
MIFRPDFRAPGFALPVAVFALVVVGLLVTGGFYVARQESRIGVATEKGTTAFYIAERGGNEVLEAWNASTVGQLDGQDSTMRTAATEEGRYRVTVTKLSDWLYFLNSQGTVTRGGQMLNGATRTVGTLAKIRTIDMRPPAALTTVGGLAVGGSSQVVGYDSAPEGWDGVCDAGRTEDAPGILIDDTGEISSQGAKFELLGDPPVSVNPTLTSDELLSFGDFPWNELVAMATVKLPPGATVTQTQPDSVSIGGHWICTTGQWDNWGDPLNPGAACGNHFPVIYAQGNARIQSGDYGQGILLVEGDLQLTGGYSFFGPVVVKGTVSTTGTGAHFFGGLIAANVQLETTTVLGDALVQYSSCTVTRALLNNAALAIARPLAQRSWVDMTNVTN